MRQESVSEREIDALQTAMTELNQKSGLILTDNEEKEITFNGGKITVMPVYKWLLVS